MPRHRTRCGACLVLNRRCTPLCIFAPYFFHEEGSTYFAVIRNVFGDRNASILLAELLVSDQIGPAVTLTIKALARHEDLVYGCISHINALQQQFSDLQACRAFLQDLLFANHFAYPQPIPNWSHPQPNPNPIPKNASLPSFPEATSLPYPADTSSSQWPLRDDIDELGPIVFNNHRRH
ncbi:LOB domain-containing protein 18-like [Diospyros lotus]|uniref:LOB domain-containing protein 18-like n=1 Tax=Diospyros lotus TaxID=55363 RepID=UPI0022524C75|nr:LOB domain-containing protein 18-like [Diospyros lotus]